jgi:hypothetical protein
LLIILKISQVITKLTLKLELAAQELYQAATVSAKEEEKNKKKKSPKLIRCAKANLKVTHDSQRTNCQS